MMPTAGDLFDFVIKNKGSTTFMGMSEERIASMIMEGLKDETLFYAVNQHKQICGMILAIVDVEKRIVFVTENLAIKLSNLRIFAKMAKERWPEYKLEAIRHGSHRKFNTNKLYTKLIKE